MAHVNFRGNVEHLEESSGDLNGLTASASSQHPQELFVPPFAAQKCFRCEENRVISMLERRSRMFQWTDRPHDEDDQHAMMLQPRSPRSPKAGFLHGSLKEEVHAGPLCKPCFAKETIGKTTLFLVFWYLANFIYESFRASRAGNRLANFPAPRLLQALFSCTQAGLSGLFHLTQWGKKPSAIAGMSWKSYFFKVVPPGIATAIDVNLAEPHHLIPKNFKAMSKAGGPLVLLLLTYAFHLEKPSFRLTASMASLTAGVFLTVAQALDHHFEPPEVALLTFGALVPAFRWTGTQILLQREILHLATPFSTMRVMKPVMAIITIMISFYTESWATLGEHQMLNTKFNIFMTILVTTFGLCLATIKTVAELILIARTSALTFAVALVIKDMLHVLSDLIGSGSIFESAGQREGSLKEEIVGIQCILLGIVLFVWHRYQQWDVRVRVRSVFVVSEHHHAEEDEHLPDHPENNPKSLQFQLSSPSHHEHSQ